MSKAIFGPPSSIWNICIKCYQKSKVPKLSSDMKLQMASPNTKEILFEQKSWS